MKHSTLKPPMPPPDYGQSLSGFTVNLLTTNIERALVMQRDVLQAEVWHQDEDLLILRGFGTSWLVHADHTYDKHPLLQDCLSHSRRGAGVELRLHDCNPDAVAARAIKFGFKLLDGPRDQPDHGLREAHVIDDDGYIWVPDLPISNGPLPILPQAE